MKIRYSIILALLICSCSKAGSGSQIGGSETTVISPPVASLMISPAKDQVCTTGTDVSSTMSTITFTWQKSNYTDVYEVHIKNLLVSRDSVIKTTSQLTLTVDLIKSTPYSWYVVSKSNQTTKIAQSATWKFYNSGPGISVNTPYPAQINSPLWGAQIAGQGYVTLQWNSGLTNSNIKEYDVYFSTITQPSVYKTQLATNQLQVYGFSGQQYYWKVVSRDNDGNTSTSETYNFYVR
jgi:hypothetical protein